MPFEDCTNPDERPIGFYQVILHGECGATIALWGGKRWMTCETLAHSSRVQAVGPLVRLDRAADHVVNPAWLERYKGSADAP